MSVRTNISGRSSTALRSADRAVNTVPSASCPAGSIAPPGSLSRHSPMPSKFSSAKPSGSITRWQLAHVGLRRCISSRARSERLLAGLVLLSVRHVRRRRRRRRAEDVLEDPLAAQHRRRAVRIRRHRQDAALTEQAAALVALVSVTRGSGCRRRWGCRSARQPLVHEGVVGVEQIEHAAVLAHDALEEQLRSRCGTPAAARCRSSGKSPGVGMWPLQVAQHQPLAGEVVDQRPRLRIGEHPPHLPLEHRRLVEQAPSRRERRAARRRDRAPQEERQTRGQLEVADRPTPRGRRRPFRAEQELRAREDQPQALLDAGSKCPSSAPAS